MFPNKYYTFFVHSHNDSKLAELVVIKANKDMNIVLNENPKRVSELRDGNLLIEVNNEGQWCALSAIIIDRKIFIVIAKSNVWFIELLLSLDDIFKQNYRHSSIIDKKINECDMPYELSIV